MSEYYYSAIPLELIMAIFTLVLFANSNLAVNSNSHHTNSKHTSSLFRVDDRHFFYVTALR